MYVQQREKSNQDALGPVHIYSDIFESATFSFQIKKFSCPHKACKAASHKLRGHQKMSEKRDWNDFIL